MHVTLHRGVRDADLLTRLWVIYERAYSKVAATTVTYERFLRPDFDECLAEDTNRVWIVWDDGLPVGLAVISTDLAANRWLSSEYFERSDPERALRGLVHYLMFVVVDGPYQAGTALIRIARAVLEMEAAEGAVLVFDLPEVNQPQEVGGLAELMRRMAKMVGESEVRQIEVQRYYSVEFAGSAPVPAATLEADELSGVSGAVDPGS
jgi:hypothetical protein